MADFVNAIATAVAIHQAQPKRYVYSSSSSYSIRLFSHALYDLNLLSRICTVFLRQPCIVIHCRRWGVPHTGATVLLLPPQPQPQPLNLLTRVILMLRLISFGTFILYITIDLPARTLTHPRPRPPIPSCSGPGSINLFRENPPITHSSNSSASDLPHPSGCSVAFDDFPVAVGSKQQQSNTTAEHEYDEIVVEIVQQTNIAAAASAGAVGATAIAATAVAATAGKSTNRAVVTAPYPLRPKSSIASTANNHKELRRVDPSWTTAIIDKHFFAYCPHHPGLRNNAKKFYCLGCGPKGGNDGYGANLCDYCMDWTSPLKKDDPCRGCCGGRVIQIYRYMYQDIIRVENVKGLVDLSGIQQYRANDHPAVHLRPVPPPSNKSPYTTQCQGGCGRFLDPQWTFCSLACKLGMGDAYNSNPPTLTMGGDPGGAAAPLPGGDHAGGKRKGGKRAQGPIDDEKNTSSSSLAIVIPEKRRRRQYLSNQGARDKEDHHDHEEHDDVGDIEQHKNACAPMVVSSTDLMVTMMAAATHKDSADHIMSLVRKGGMYHSSQRIHSRRRKHCSPRRSPSL